jgi:hypothetical protein
MGIPVTLDIDSADNTVNFCNVFCRQLDISSSTILQSALGMTAAISRPMTITCLDSDSRRTWQRDDMPAQGCNPSDAELSRGYVLAPRNRSQRVNNGKVVFEILRGFDEVMTKRIPGNLHPPGNEAESGVNLPLVNVVSKKDTCRKAVILPGMSSGLFI